MRGSSCDVEWPLVQPRWMPCQSAAAASPRCPSPPPCCLDYSYCVPHPQASTFQLPSHQLHPGLASQGTEQRPLKFPTPQRLNLVLMGPLTSITPHSLAVFQHTTLNLGPLREQQVSCESDCCLPALCCPAVEKGPCSSTQLL